MAKFLLQTLFGTISIVAIIVAALTYDSKNTGPTVCLLLFAGVCLLQLIAFGVYELINTIRDIEQKRIDQEDIGKSWK